MEKKINVPKPVGQPLRVTVVKGENWNSTKAINFGGAEVEFSGYFASNTAITSIVNGTIINDNGDRMFSDCVNLTDFNCSLPNIVNGGTAFAKCPISSFTANVDSLETGSNMFSGCTSLQSFEVNMPQLVSGDNMFFGCSSLTTFNAEIPNLTNGRQMFRGCSSLTSFSADMPKLVSGAYMFNDCSSLTSFSATLPELVNSNYMFNNCTSLAELYLNMPKSSGADIPFSLNVTYPDLTDVVLLMPSYSGSIKFSSTYFPSLKKVTESTNISSTTVVNSMIHSGVTDAHFIFNNAEKLYSICRGGSSLTSATIEARQLKEADSMFLGCSSLTNVNMILGDSKIENAKSMFYNCASLSNIDIDLSNLVNGGSMFQGCTSLTSFSADMPNLITATSMFSGCQGLTDIYFNAPQASGSPLGGSYSNLTSITLNIPIASGLVSFTSATNYPNVKIVNLTTNWSGTSSGAYYTVISNKIEDATLCFNNATYLHKLCNNASALTRVSITCPNLTLPKSAANKLLSNCPALQYVEIITSSANSGWTMSDVSYGTTPILPYRYVDDLGDGLVKLTFSAEERKELKTITLHPDDVTVATEDDADNNQIKLKF